MNKQGNNSSSLRRMRFAGSWYEADPFLLEKQLSDYSNNGASTSAQERELHSSVVAIVAPHAGYFYSGKAAASAYRAASNRKIKRVFLLGPSHYAAFHGIALSNAAAFETPFGNIVLDQKIIHKLYEHPLFLNHEEAHRFEHSLEMQLPFIKNSFGDALLIPLLVGHLTEEKEIVELASFLKNFIQEEDLIVVSSDFTHYGPRFGYTPFSHSIREKIQQSDMKAYRYLESHDLAGFLQFQKETQSTICGFYPLALLVSLLPQTAKASLLDYYTSQEVMNSDLENSVSYLAIAFSR